MNRSVMHITSVVLPRPKRGISATLRTLGEAMRRYRTTIIAIQWMVVAVYVVLVTVPAFLELPGEDAHLWDNLTRLAQFAFWGVWWPFVILSMVAFGRLWCGVFCPEGALSEFASRHGLGKAIPRWMRWGGWPFVAFASTTIYGQLVSVYEYPKPVLLILGGSTVAAVVVGLVYGRGTRVWCRHLCPANGVFRLLARLAPVHFRVDEEAWKQADPRTPAVECAPLVDLRHLRSAAPCHACGRCSGHRDAVWLAARSPNVEILAMREAPRWEALLLIFGVLGLATGAFQWSASPWFVALKQAAATWLVERDSYTLLQDNAPWWLLTHYPQVSDAFTWLDGLAILIYIGTYTVIVGGFILAMLWLAQRVLVRPGFMWRLAFSLIPIGGISLFLGLSMLTLGQLSAEGLSLPWAPWVRAALLTLAFAWSGWLAGRLIHRTATPVWRRVTAITAHSAAMLAVIGLWSLQFYAW
jgi:polyferredoxin